MSQTLSRLFIAAAIALSLAAPSAHATVKKMVQSCDAGLCPIFLPELPVPAGWQVDDAASKANGVVVLVPAGFSFGDAEAVIYARAFHNAEKRTIASRVEESNSHWLGQIKDAKIERLADISGQQQAVPFQLYRYSNPSTSQQTAEIVAFGEDTDRDGNDYGVQMVITAMSEANLDKYRSVFLDLIKAY